ncbi:SubName: Full=Uncharacterized protein {ECO:0000313/EMBL:CCA71140.1} [Serendipita indica DSM 11827]|uniref:DUF6593 domain-containing protein n=1 Tax=Serendipita indica (strain DSM 11827) TaxID=1109443 RepID=G4TIJ6_SERID|nr:SubName: Full=Uncharacterized protein {ECO:0000313/EMBL:CCA71140.1} [Serendipita indica DSM 11827]CCA71140.1 hypothetical protein PIIN_05075 [Serendipita indica DSM 11827]
MSIHLLASNNSVRNTTLSCDSMGIHYEVSKSSQTGIVSVHRWESTSNQNVLAGEIEFHWFSADLLRMGDGEWRRRKDLLANEERNPMSRTRTFTGNNGVRYKWKFHWDSLQLCHADRDATNQEALVVYHRHFLPNKPSYLEIRDTSVLPGLDSIIVTFLYMEKKRRDRDKAQRRHGAGGGP